MKKEFYTCKNDRAFKEVFLNPNNSDLLKALLEFILKIKIDKLEIKKTELLSGNVNIKDKRVDAIVHTGNKKIEIEINSQNKDYLHTRSTAYICNIYQSNANVGDTYNEDTDIIQVNLTWGLGRNNDEMKIYKIMNEKGELYVKNFIIYEINMDYYDKIWYSKNEEEIKKNQYMIMLDLDKKELKNMLKDKIVDKYITNVTVTSNKGVQSYDYEKQNKVKIDVKNLKNTSFRVSYLIELENSRYFPGTIGNIIETIPEGMTFNPNLPENDGWYESEGNLYYKDLNKTMIMPGEKYYITIVLDLVTNNGGDYINFVAATDLKIKPVITNFLEIVDDDEYTIINGQDSDEEMEEGGY